MFENNTKEKKSNDKTLINCIKSTPSIFSLINPYIPASAEYWKKTEAIDRTKNNRILGLSKELTFIKKYLILIIFIINNLSCGFIKLPYFQLKNILLILYIYYEVYIQVKIKLIATAIDYIMLIPVINVSILRLNSGPKIIR